MMRRTRETNSCITRPSHFTNLKVGHTGTETALFPTNVLPTHVQCNQKTIKRQERLVNAGRYSRSVSYNWFQRSSLCWKDCRLRVQQKTSLTYSHRQVRSFLVGFGLNVTGIVNNCVVDAEIRATQSGRMQNASLLYYKLSGG